MKTVQLEQFQTYSPAQLGKAPRFHEGNLGRQQLWGCSLLSASWNIPLLPQSSTSTPEIWLLRSRLLHLLTGSGISGLG